MGNRRAILIGLDGVGQDEIHQWQNPESLSNLNRIARSGVKSDLFSTLPPWTPCAWPSLLSGLNPGEHGVFDFFTRKGYEKRLIDRQNVEAPYLSDVVAATDLTPLLINYPVTHPVPELDHGAVVPGYLSPENTEFYPENLRGEYEAEHETYAIYPEYGAETDIVENYVSVARHRRDMARFLDERYDWDLMAVQFQVTDSIFHDLDDRDKIRQVLEKVDEFVGDIVALDQDAAVFIVSDHGMGDYEWTFYINSWLAENGYADTTTGDEEYFRAKKEDLKGKDDEETSLLQTSLGATTTALSTMGFPPNRIHRLLSSVGLAGTVERLLPEEALLAAQDQIVDYENSTAFQIFYNSLGIHLNLEGREPEGTVTEEQYDEVRSELIEELSQVRDPDGNLVFDDVLRKEEVYEGKNIEKAPDILLVPRDYQYDVSGSIVEPFRRNPHKNHKPEGIFVTNLEASEPLDDASIYDVAPTVAASLGLPIDTQADGEVLPVVEDHGKRADWSEMTEQYRTTERKSTDGDVEERLADLGYME